MASELGALAVDSERALAELLYLQGKVAYFGRRYDVAEASFRQALASSERSARRIRACLGGSRKIIRAEVGRSNDPARHIPRGWRAVLARARGPVAFARTSCSG